MLEAYGDIWEHAKDYDAIVITTNGFVKKNGEAVLGRGIAKQAVQRYPWLPRILGKHLWGKGNHVGLFQDWSTEGDPTAWPEQTTILTMPVKPDFGPKGEPGWRVKADLQLIARSAKELVQEVDALWFKKVLMPRPGCGNGGLKWENVKPVIEPILDDRFTVMERNY